MSIHQQQTQSHNPNSYQHHVNHNHTSYRCYIRTTDMRCKIQPISTDQSVQQLKQTIKTILNLQPSTQASNLKLIVNETQLTNQMNLTLHLFQNAIIHVLIPQAKYDDDIAHSQINIKIKQPPIDSLPVIVPNIPLNMQIKKLKSKIISFYQTQQQNNPISQLNDNDLYLVYGGRILANEQTLRDYDIDENGILYVVNGKIYAKQVTKQQAEKRIQQVKRSSGQLYEGNTQQQQKQPLQDQEVPQSSSLLNQQQDVVFNIIQNIVHDQDSDVEGQAGNDLARSQKIIHRYDSVSKNIKSINAEDNAITLQQEHETPHVDQQEDEFHKQISQHHASQLNAGLIQQSNEENQALQIEQKQTQSVPEEHNPVYQYLDEIGKKIVSYEDEPFSQNNQNIEGGGQQVQAVHDQLDSIPQQDQDLLM